MKGRCPVSSTGFWSVEGRMVFYSARKDEDPGKIRLVFRPNAKADKQRSADGSRALQGITPAGNVEAKLRGNNMTTKASSATTTAVNGTQLSLVAIIRGKRGLGDEGASSCHSSRPRACQNRATSTTTCNRSNDDPDVCFFMRTGRHLMISRRISNCLT